MHGIGSQVRGQTVLSWAEPLLELLAHAGPHHGLRSRVLSATGLNDDAPETTLEIVRDDGRKATWLLTEARWSEDFHPSPASDVLLWAARFSWRVARRGIGGLLAQLWFVWSKRVFPVLRAAFPRESGCIGFVATPIVWVVILFFGGGLLIYMLVVPYALFAILLLAAAPLLIVVAVMAVVALIALQRVPVIGRRLTPIVAALVTSVGDAQAYRDRAIQAAAMRDVVLRQVAAAASRADSVVVVAHSQGAAIACRALLERLTEWPAQLITVGAGTTLLNDEQSVGQWRALGCPPWVNVWTPLDPVPSGPVGDDQASIRNRLLETLWHHTSDGGFQGTSPDGRRALHWRPGAGPDCWSGSDELLEQARVSRGGTMSGVAAALPTTETVMVPLQKDEARRIATALLRDDSGAFPQWIDTPLPRVFETPGPEEWPVANRCSLLQDHTSYSANITQVQHPIVRMLLDQAQATAEALPRPTPQAVNRHVIRVRILGMSRLVCAVAAAAAVGVLIAVDVSAPLLDAMDWASDRWGTWGWLVDAAGPSVVGSAVLAAAGIVVFACLSGLLRSSWLAWHRGEGLRICAQPDGPRVRFGLGGVIFFTTYLGALAFSVAWWGWTLYDGEETLAGLAVLLLVPMYLTWALVWPFAGMRPRPLPARA